MSHAQTVASTVNPYNVPTARVNDGSAYLFGNRNGERARLEDEGVAFQLGLTDEAAHNFTGGTRELTRNTSQVLLGSSLDLDKLFGWAGASFRVAITERSGHDLGNDAQIGRLEHALRMAAPATSPQVVLHFVKELPRTSADWTSMLRATGQRRHGIIMLVHDNEDASEALARMGPAPVPVAALTFDIQTIAHRFYIGIDNEAAARTAAFMIARTSPPRGRVLMLSGPQEFLLHRQRSAAFVEALARLSPGLDLVGPIDMADRSDTARRATLAAMHADSPLVAIYNSGGANIGISRALATAPTMPRPVWIAHEGTPGNLALPKKGEITMILDQDPDAQASAALNYILYANGEIGSAPEANIRFHVLTPENS